MCCSNSSSKEAVLASNAKAVPTTLAPSQTGMSRASANMPSCASAVTQINWKVIFEGRFGLVFRTYRWAFDLSAMWSMESSTRVESRRERFVGSSVLIGACSRVGGGWDFERYFLGCYHRESKNVETQQCQLIATASTLLDVATASTTTWCFTLEANSCVWTWCLISLSSTRWPLIFTCMFLRPT